MHDTYLLDLLATRRICRAMSLSNHNRKMYIFLLNKELEIAGYSRHSYCSKYQEEIQGKKITRVFNVWSVHILLKPLT